MVLYVRPRARSGWIWHSLLSWPPPLVRPQSHTRRVPMGRQMATSDTTRESFCSIDLNVSRTCMNSTSIVTSSSMGVGSIPGVLLQFSACQADPPPTPVAEENYGSLSWPARSIYNLSFTITTLTHYVRTSVRQRPCHTRSVL